MQKNIDLFKPSYIWPNPAFHFRLYYESNNCRIFLIENIAHNWLWLKKYHTKFRKNDFFFVQLGWYFDEYLVRECNHIFEILGLRKDRFIFMFPDFPAKTLFEYYGFQGDLVNHNCFLDENLFHIKSSEKKYDAIYTARLSPFKRHHLASKIGNLALVAGNTSTKLIEELPPHSFINDKHLLPEQVIDIISESKVGIILSDFEGACYSSSEYLLCGIPVVSTRSHGGRDVWYNSYNSIICDPTPESVADAVKKLASLKRKPEEIRSMHIHQSQYFQQNFINLFQKSLTLGSDHIDAKEYFKDNYKHKLLPSTTPEFDALFN